MTKILIFSDSHGDIETMARITGTVKPDMVIHLGDYLYDADMLNVEYPNINFIKIPDNTNKKNDNDKVKFENIYDKKIMMTHGHFYNVDNEEEGLRNIKGIQKLMEFGFGNGADIIMFGHSHMPYLNCINGKWIMNPGRIGKKSSKIIYATYSVLHIEPSGKIKWDIVEA